MGILILIALGIGITAVALTSHMKDERRNLHRNLVKLNHDVDKKLNQLNNA